MASLLPEVDRAALKGDAGEDLAANFDEAVRKGAAGWIDDDLAFISPGASTRPRSRSRPSSGRATPT
jgi:hypothetical protein